MKSKNKRGATKRQKGSAGDRKPITNISPGLERLYRRENRERRPLKKRPLTFSPIHQSAGREELNEVSDCRAVFSILRSFETTGRRLDVLIREYIGRRQADLSSRDKGWITRTAQNAARWQIRLDYITSRLLRQDAAGLDLTFRILLRLAALFVVITNKAANRTREILEATVPEEAAQFRRPIRNFIKDLARHKNVIPYPDRSTAAGMTIYYSHPEWLVNRWISMFGPEETRKLCEYNNAETHLTLRVNLLKADPNVLIEQLKAHGYSVMKSRFATWAYYLSGRGEVFQTPQFLDGWFEIQDESSQLFVEWCDPKPGQLVIDVCAGAGGKSLAFASLTKNEIKLVAGDINPKALAEFKERAARNGCVVHDMEFSHDRIAAYRRSADIVLVDAPCSGLGTLNRNPDIKMRIEEEDIQRLQEEQLGLLRDYADCVKVGGRLIYATCTLTREENEEVAQRFLNEHSEYVLYVPDGERWSNFMTTQGYFTILPQKHNLGGFFGCQLKRVSEK